jgi:hypothetical protein
MFSCLFRDYEFICYCHKKLLFFILWGLPILTRSKSDFSTSESSSRSCPKLVSHENFQTSNFQPVSLLQMFNFFLQFLYQFLLVSSVLGPRHAYYGIPSNALISFRCPNFVTGCPNFRNNLAFLFLFQSFPS